MGREVSRHVVESLTERLRNVERGDASQMSPRGDDALPTFNMTKDGIGLWSSASSRGFEVAEAEGNVDSYTIAADMKRGDWLFGLGVTHSKGEGEYEATTVESDLTTAHPYAAWMHREWLAWATLGKGTGTLKMHDTESDAHYSGIDINHTMLAAGVDREHMVGAIPEGQCRREGILERHEIGLHRSGGRARARRESAEPVTVGLHTLDVQPRGTGAAHARARARTRAG